MEIEQTTIRIQKNVLDVVDQLAEIHFRSRNSEIAWLLSVGINHADEIPVTDRLGKPKEPERRSEEPTSK